MEKQYEYWIRKNYMVFSLYNSRIYAISLRHSRTKIMIIILAHLEVFIVKLCPMFCSVIILTIRLGLFTFTTSLLQPYAHISRNTVRTLTPAGEHDFNIVWLKLPGRSRACHSKLSRSVLKFLPRGEYHIIDTYLGLKRAVRLCLTY